MTTNPPPIIDPVRIGTILNPHTPNLMAEPPTHSPEAGVHIAENVLVSGALRTGTSTVMLGLLHQVRQIPDVTTWVISLNHGPLKKICGDGSLVVNWCATTLEDAHRMADEALKMIDARMMAIRQAFIEYDGPPRNPFPNMPAIVLFADFSGEPTQHPNEAYHQLIHKIARIAHTGYAGRVHLVVEVRLTLTADLFNNRAVMDTFGAHIIMGCPDDPAELYYQFGFREGENVITDLAALLPREPGYGLYRPFSHSAVRMFRGDPPDWSTVERAVVERAVREYPPLPAPTPVTDRAPAVVSGNVRFHPAIDPEVSRPSLEVAGALVSVSYDPETRQLLVGVNTEGSDEDLYHDADGVPRVTLTVNGDTVYESES